MIELYEADSMMGKRDEGPRGGREDVCMVLVNMAAASVTPLQIRDAAQVVHRFIPAQHTAVAFRSAAVPDPSRCY